MAGGSSSSSKRKAKEDAELKKLLDEKKENERELERLEKQIFNLEGAYLVHSTNREGNAVAGWGKSGEKLKVALHNTKALPLSDEEMKSLRIFSKSSKTSPFYKQEEIKA